MLIRWVLGFLFFFFLHMKRERVRNQRSGRYRSRSTSWSQATDLHRSEARWGIPFFIKASLHNSLLNSLFPSFLGVTNQRIYWRGVWGPELTSGHMAPTQMGQFVFKTVSGTFQLLLKCSMASWPRCAPILQPIKPEGLDSTRLFAEANNSSLLTWLRLVFQAEKEHS